MSNDYRYLEQRIDYMTYPAKLSNKAKRLLAFKLQEVSAEYKDRRDELIRARDNVSREKRVDTKGLPTALRPVARKYLKAVKAVKDLTLTLQKHGVKTAWGGDEFWLSCGEAEYNRRKQQANDALAKLDAEEKAASADIRLVAQQLAQAEVAALKAKLEKTSPGIMAKLDYLGQKRLTGTVVVEPVSE